MPTWRLTIPKPIGPVEDTGTAYVLEGEDATKPTLTLIAPPPIKPPVTPPVTPPDDPYAPLPGEDRSPFVWPGGGPTGQMAPEDRPYPLATAGYGAHIYAATMEAGRPGGCGYAGTFAPGAMLGPRDLGGMAAWVMLHGEEIRDGHSVPLTEPPGWLLRRALKTGRLFP